MKNLMLRGLDHQDKKDVVEIIKQYMKRPGVVSPSATKAIEGIVRQFDCDERRNLEYNQRTEAELHGVRQKVEELTLSLSDAGSRRKAFTRALADLTAED